MHHQSSQYKQTIALAIVYGDVRSEHALAHMFFFAILFIMNHEVL